MSDLYVVLWKEIKELLRDRRTILMVVLTPILTLPLMGIALVYLPSIQEVTVAILDEDRVSATVGDLTISSHDIVDLIERYLVLYGYIVVKDGNSSAQVVLRIPAGFIANLTSYEYQASAVLVKRLGSPRVDQAVSYIEGLLNYVSRVVSEAKVKALGRLANITVRPEAVLSPIAVRTYLLTPSGMPAGTAEELKLYLGRVLALSLAFVTTPAATYIADSLVGEKERRTLEKLLSTPISRSSLIVGKSIAASLIGLVGGGSSVIGGLLLYIAPALMYSADILKFVSPEVFAVLFCSSYISILVSLSISLPVVLRSPSIRSASLSSTLLIGVASVVYIASLFMNLDELKMPLALVLAIPYASLASAVVRASLGEYLKAVTYLTYSLAISLLLILLSTKLLDPERMITSKT